MVSVQRFPDVNDVKGAVCLMCNVQQTNESLVYFEDYCGAVYMHLQSFSEQLVWLNCDQASQVALPNLSPVISCTGFKVLKLFF